MAARFATSTAIRGALAAHASISATSVLCSVLGRPSQLSVDPENSLQQKHDTSRNNISTDTDVLPWLEQLHNLVASIYVNGGVNHQCFTATSSLQNNNNNQNNNVTMVKIAKNISLENPIVSYSGISEVDRAFKGRLFLHPQSDIKTILECIQVEASEDSICGGQEEHTQPFLGITPSISSPPSSSPPKVKVTYRLSQQYGSFFSMNSLLVVTIQVREGCSERVRKINANEKKLPMPLATSGLTKSASSVAIAANSGLVSVALAKAASKFAAVTAAKQHSTGRYDLLAHSAPLVAEVVRIEEQWRGVQLLHLAPFYWSRRLNGFVAGSAAYFFFH